jgi:phosphoenolpyruvate---glycerone phosphotransferase subunit DhaK
LKKLINEPGRYVDEALSGMLAAHRNTFAMQGQSGRVIVRASVKPAGRVGLVTGGGFGHLPLFAGYVGEGLLDACAVGDVFAGPSMTSVNEALEAADHGAGVLVIIGNYGGDRMVFNMAAEARRSAGHPVEIVIGNDDIASAVEAERMIRRGVAGLIFSFKVAGAAAEAGLPLSHCRAAAERMIERSRTIGVALSPCILPARGKPTFEIESNSVEMGMGIHGEKGVWRGPHRSADALVDEMLGRLTAELSVSAASRVAVLCNSLGATPLEELYILYRRIDEVLSQRGATIVHTMVGHYVTSMEMAGASISLVLLDEELESFLTAPVISPFWRPA